jgi:ribosomal protein S18 acetylase RimI-like enzyme
MNGSAMRPDPEVTIAVATAADALGMADVHYAAWLATYPNAEHGITVEDVQHRLRNYKAPERMADRQSRLENPPDGHTTLVAKIAGAVVGFCHVIKHADANQLAAIYIHPDQHGKGIGTALWRASHPYLWVDKPTYVMVATYNRKAIAFYEGLGFTDTGERLQEERFRLKSGSIIPELKMQRPPGF